MKRFRPPKKLFDGRVRTSTVALSLLFVAVLALYLVVRQIGRASCRERV